MGYRSLGMKPGVWEPGNEVNISVCSLRARKGLLTCS